ncbi:MFS transporter [Alsobacter sp. R-9]
MSEPSKTSSSVPAEAWRALALLTAARTAMGFQFQSFASVSGPLGQQFGLSQADIGTLIGLYFAPGILIALPGGALGARFGDRRMVMAGLALMAVGGLGAAFADSFGTLAAARLVSGVGGVLLNVLMTKMVADWFSGRPALFLAMAVFVNSFPVGVGLSALVLGPVATGAGWRTAFEVAAALAGVALCILAFGYRPHPNDGRGVAAASSRLLGREVVLVCLAGAIWGIFNGVFAITVGLVPQVGLQAGIDPAQVRLAVGLATWLLVASVLAGGALAPKRVAPGRLMAIGGLVWALCMVVLALRPPLFLPAMAVAGLVMGLPVGAILALPARVLRPESRSLGMGLFFTWLYIGHGALPPLAGWLQDRAGSADAAAFFAAAMAALMTLLYASFIGVERRRRTA